MTKLMFLLLILFILVGAAHAQSTAVLGSQFGGPTGFSSGDGHAQCVDPHALKYEQCAAISSPRAAVGTITVKTSAELLIALRCGGGTVYQMERFQGTSDFVTPPFPIGTTGPCWIYYEVLNNSGLPLPNGPHQGGLFEYQVVLYGQ
jgi:hypothetical protein